MPMLCTPFKIRKRKLLFRKWAGDTQHSTIPKPFIVRDHVEGQVLDEAAQSSIEVQYSKVHDEFSGSKTK